MKFDQGYFSSQFVTDKKTLTCEFTNPYILLVDHKLNSARSLLPILEQVLQQNRQLLIISSDGVESEVLNTLVVNKLNSGLKVCAIKAPGFGDDRNDTLQDIAVLTGAEIVCHDLGHKIEDVRLKSLGTAKNITVTADSTVILGGGGKKEDILERCQVIRDKVKSEESDYSREKSATRLARLSGGVAVIRVGGASEVEATEKKDRVVDALNATRAAIEEGIVAGGGAALLYCSLALNNLKGDNFDQKVGIDIVKKAVQTPIRQIVKNADEEDAVIVSRLLDPPSGIINQRLGYNALTSKYVDMFAEGIIDPVKVVRTALEDSASVAGIMITSQCLVTEEEDKEDSDHQHGHGGMM